MTAVPNQTQNSALRILSLDGDGVSVLSELTIIQELMYRIQSKLGSQVMPRPCELFQLIGGTGTGGLVAILLGRLRLTIEEAALCYLSIMGQVFNKKNDGPEDRARELERVLKEILGRYCNDADAPMMGTGGETAKCKVIVYAMPEVAIQASTPTCIRTYRVAENQGPECSIVEAIRATTATPGILKRKAIHDGELEVSYVGAVLGCNNPTAQLLVEAGRAYPGWATACVFSTGAGRLQPVGLHEPKRLLGSMSSQLAAAAEAIAKDCERVHQEVAVRFSHAVELYFRFNPEHGMQDIDQTDSKRLSDVRTHTKSYLADATTSGRLNDAVKAITSGRGAAMLLNGNVILLVQNQLPIGRCPAPSAMFTGREDLLEALRAYFFDHPHERHLFVLYGLGGAGKTQLALAFVHRYKKLFWDIFYIDATTHDTIKAELKQLAKRAKAGDTHEDALDWFASQEKRWLIVYNNTDDPAIDLSDYFPKCTHGDILITTRNHAMIVHASDPTAHIRVGDMQEDDAQTLLFKISGEPKTPESETAATSLIKQLGFLALSVVQAGAYMRSTPQCNMLDYLDLFTTSRDQLLAQRLGQTDGYKLSTYATWDISYRRLIPRAAQLLRLMSFMHHDGISMEFFKTATANLSTFSSNIPLTAEEASVRDVAWDFLKHLMTSANTWNTLRWHAMTNNLCSFSLLSYDSGNMTYSMHPLVHSWCRSIITDANNVREHAAWVLGLCVKQRGTSEDYAFRRLVLPHATALLASNEPITPPLAARLAWIFEDANDTKQVEKLYSDILQNSRERLGDNHATTLACRYDMGWVYKSQGRWDDAEVMLLEVLEAQRQVLGQEHLDVLRTMYELALTYKRQGRWNEAEAMLLEVLDVERGVLDKDDPDLLSTKYNLASTYRSQGRLSEAEAMLLEVLEVERRVLGKEHPHLLSTMSSLASTYQSQGRWSEAESMLLEVLEARRRVLGKEHPNFLSTMSTLASTYNSQGRWSEAEAMLLEVLEVRRRVLGKEHPDLLSTMFTLAQTHESQGRWNEAEVMLLEVLEVRRRVLGKEHPHLLSTMSSLASTYQSQGRWSEAESMLLEVLEVRRQVLGKEHPRLLSTMSSLASTYQSQGRWSEAESMLLEVLEVRRRVLGKEHPDLLSTMSSLASTYNSQGRWSEAESMLLEVLEVERRVLGKEHPSLLSAMSSLASTYESQGRWKEAESMLLEVLEVERRVPGKEHPHLLNTMHELASTYNSQKRWKEAETLLVEVVEARKRVLGREHPNTMASISLLASVYWGQGRLSDAELLHVEDLETTKRVLGPKHPETLTSMHNLALTYKNQGKLVEAERLMTEALELSKQVIGEQHHDTKKSAWQLARIRARLAQPRDS